MIVNLDILEQRFIEFSQFVETNDNKAFESFETCIYFDKEKYKEVIYNEARITINSAQLKFKDIGTGRIHKTICDAIKKKVVYKNEDHDNNLINWRKKDLFSKLDNPNNLEVILFELYTSKVPDQISFERLLQEKLSYQLIAYLFFIKESKKYMPIAQEKFDNVFKLIGLGDFKTSHNISWDNYSNFIDIIKQVRNFLKSKDPNTSLLDAHSFLYILSCKIQNSGLDATLKSLVENESELSNDETNTFEEEEYDKLLFPEGKELYKLHKSKERNIELVKAAKLKHLQSDNKLCCQVCDFSFVQKYGEIGEGFIEAHHLFPISELTEETKTKIDDLVLVCSNCHRMLHRKRPWINLSELKNIIK